MEINNYNEFDTLEIYARKNKVDHIKSCYQSFSWHVVEEKENDRYSDTIDLTFQRPHKLKNKDELQLMQVYMEDTLNKYGSLERHKHAKSTTYGLCFGVLSLAILIAGIIILKNSLLNILFGGTLIVLGLLSCMIVFVVCLKLFKTEKETFEQSRKKLQDDLETICKKAKKLAGGK